MNDAIIEQIKAHAARVFPLEACGLILTIGGSLSVLECDNQSHQPEQSFLIDPLLQAQYHGKIAAVYHSHPNRSAAPSAADIASAERCNLPFLIVNYPECEWHSYTPRGVLPAPYVGRSFVYGVMDCLSLVSDFYRHELSIDLKDGERKDYGWWHHVEHYHAMVNGFKSAGFQRVDVPQVNDIVVMQLQGVCPHHVGIYRGDNVILHHATGLSREEMYNQYWRNRTVCFLRHHSL